VNINVKVSMPDVIVQSVWKGQTELGIVIENMDLTRFVRMNTIYEVLPLHFDHVN
jgi:hypothetical protein